MARPYVGSLVIGEESRRDRRRRERIEKSARAEIERATRDEQRARRQADRDAEEVGEISARGEDRPLAGRTMWQERLQSYSASTRTLRVAYPFLAERGLGTAGMFMGYDVLTLAPFAFDPWELYLRQRITNPNIAVAGVIGTGKSSLCKAIATRGMAFGRRVYVPGDIKGEWSAITRAVGGPVIELGPGSPHRLNPLDEGTRPARDAWGGNVDDERWKKMVRQARNGLLVALTTATVGRALQPVEYTALSAALDDAVVENSTPILSHVAQRLLEPSESLLLPTGVRSADELARMGSEIGHALMRMVYGDLSGTFNGPSTAKFDASAPMVSVDLKSISENSQTLPLLMTCTSAWMESALRDPDAGQKYVIYEEAHRLLELPALLGRMKEHWKLARAWGIANVLILHRLTDLDAVGDEGSRERHLASGLLADTSVRIVHRQESDQIERTKKAMGLSNASASLIGGLPRGQALWQIGQDPFLVQHTYTRGELDLYDSDAAMRGRI